MQCLHLRQTEIQIIKLGETLKTEDILNKQEVKLSLTIKAFRDQHNILKVVKQTVILNVNNHRILNLAEMDKTVNIVNRVRTRITIKGLKQFRIEIPKQLKIVKLDQLLKITDITSLVKIAGIVSLQELLLSKVHNRVHLKVREQLEVKPIKMPKPPLTFLKILLLDHSLSLLKLNKHHLEVHQLFRPFLQVLHLNQLLIVNLQVNQVQQVQHFLL